MKYVIASDVHGSKKYCEKLIEIFDRENADYLILLGDVYNHGPRNPLPEEYNPMAVSKILNNIKDKLIVIKGNCDSQVDTLISEFDFIESMCITSNDKTIFLSHGHVYNKDQLPKTKFDCIIYGHFHLGFIEKQDDTVIANPGSISLPKDSFRGYLAIEKGELTLKSINGEAKNSMKL